MKELIFFDYLVIIAFFLVTFIIGFIYSKSKTSIEEYLVAPKSIGWIVLGLAAFAVNTSSGTIMTVTASAYSYGMVIFNYELTGIVCCILFAFIFGPVYYRNNIKTISEYLEIRFNPSSRVIFSILTILTHIFTKVSIYLFAGAVFLQEVTSLDIYSLMLLITIATGLYSILGGQKPIIYTQMIQAFFILIAGALVFAYIFNFNWTLPSVSEHYQILKPVSDNKYPWPELLTASIIIGIWYHAIDPEMAQKFLAGKSLKDSQLSTILLGFLKFSILFIVILPGLIGSFAFPGIENDFIYTEIFKTLIPPGLKGIVIAGLVAALMSSLSASYNACSTLYTFDIYKKLYPNAPNFILTNIGKIATLAIVIFSMNWVILIKYLHNDIFQFVTSAFSYMTPPIVAVYVSGILSKYPTAKAATYTLISGGIIAFVMILIEVLVETGSLSGSFFIHLVNFNFLDFTILFFFFNLLLIFIISYFDKTGRLNQKEQAIFKSDDMTSYLKDPVIKWPTFILLLAILLIYFIFS